MLKLNSYPFYSSSKGRAQPFLYFQEDRVDWRLVQDEKICWQGCPAPRCYVYRGFSVLVRLFVVMVLAGGALWWWQLPLLSPVGSVLTLMFAGCVALGPGRICYRRFCWESVFYALTNQRLLVRKRWNKAPAAYELAQLRDISIIYYSHQLATIVLTFQTETSVRLECLEQPHRCLTFLQQYVNSDK